MMKSVTAALLSLTVVSFAGPSIAAQKHPDFSGIWVEDESQRKSPFEKASGGGSLVAPGPPPPLKITQTPERITIERTFMDQVTRMSYDFDGRENVNRTGAQIHTTRTRWEGARLVTEGSVFQVTSHGETSWKLKETRWITPKGEMALERTQVDEDGAASTVFRVFRKK